MKKIGDNFAHLSETFREFCSPDKNHQKFYLIEVKINIFLFFNSECFLSLILKFDCI